MKLELKNDYVETASNPEVYAETSNSWRVYMIIGIVCVVALVAGILWYGNGEESNDLMTSMEGCIININKEFVVVTLFEQ